MSNLTQHLARVSKRVALIILKSFVTSTSTLSQVQKNDKTTEILQAVFYVLSDGMRSF